MRDLKNKLTSGKNTKNIQPRKGKSFGYQVLGFGAGGAADAFIVACGGTVTEDGNFKIHTFTGPGTFTVASLASDSANDVVDYLVVGGGASGGHRNPGNGNGGGGAGGFRYSAGTFCAAGPGAPRGAPAAIPVSVQGYTIAVGGGGARVPGPRPSGVPGNDGVASSFSSITSTGGGGGGDGSAPRPGRPGGSGGGGGGGQQAGNMPGGTGNTPPVSPPQGSNGGAGGSPSPDEKSAGGGGAMAVGGAAVAQTPNGPGGAGAGIPTAFGANGVPNAPTDAFRYYAGGGSGGTTNCFSGGTAGIGGGGNNSTNGTDNTGGGGGGGNATTSAGSGAGGSGIVVIRYRFQAD